jgi:hypothetical protein
MAGNDARTKLFEALNETSDAIIDAIRAANDRGHRVSTALIEQAQESQRETVELARKWLAAPFDIPGFYSSVVESATKAQGRVLDATRQWYGELADAQKETREVLQRMIKANRAANEATVDFARSIFSRAAEQIQSATTNGDGRKASRTAEIAGPTEP